MKRERNRREEFGCGSSMSPSSLNKVFLASLLLCFHLLTATSALNYTHHRQISTLRLARIQRHLNKINKTPVRTIQSPDGDIMDCIHRHRQPALDHPLLKNHVIQAEPAVRPRYDGMKNNSTQRSATRAWQTWHESGKYCPEGTIPIRRSSVDDVLRAKSLFHFGKKRSRRNPLSKSAEPPEAVSDGGHEHAIAFTASPSEIYGAKALINVWEPSIQVVNEFSLSQMWVLSGSFDSDLNSIEAGWQVSPELYGDSKPRLFTYWTTDAYRSTGCYNLLCSGFIQTNSKIAIGAAISPVSSFSSSQFEIPLLIWKDPKLGNWWASLGNDMPVGYWPAELFTHLSGHATMVEWGGEIVNTRSNGGHTSTQMGSGHFAEAGFGKSAYFRDLEIVNSDNSLISVTSLISTQAENSNCYNIQNSYNEAWGAYFYYGGPGNNPQCP